ncbi:MAG: hypothetical protein H7345_18135 [Rubritepida sp.]|nr:hypothetical protein [Rubritepida sp.]
MPRPAPRWNPGRKNRAIPKPGPATLATGGDARRLPQALPDRRLSRAVEPGGWKAMLAGDGDVVSGHHNKLQSAIARITPFSMLAEAHRKMTGPGSAQR